MSKKQYVDTIQVNIRLPSGLHGEVLKVMNVEKRWNSPQQFIQDLIIDYLDRWKKQHPGVL